MLTVLIVILIVLALGWGGYSARGPEPGNPYIGWSPLVGLLVLLLVLKLIGVV